MFGGAVVLAGMPQEGLDCPVGDPAPALDELRERGRLRLRQCGADRRRARGAGARDKLTAADRVLATVLYLRQLGPRDLLTKPFGINGSTRRGVAVHDWTAVDCTSAPPDATAIRLHGTAVPPFLSDLGGTRWPVPNPLVRIYGDLHNLR